MSERRIVHAADIHLDSPLRGLERYEGAPLDRLRGATRRAFRNLCDLCIDEDAELLILSGDLYDGDWRDTNTGLFFVKEMSRLREAGVRVFSVRGNHDAASRITRTLRLPDNVHDFACKRPETVVVEDLGIALHGQGFARKSVTEDLSADYPQAIPGLFNIGLLHTSLTGREGHERYAPCSVDGLRRRGYDYWALGHVHQRELVSEDPTIVFPGNLQGRHIRETGPKGATLLTLRDGQLAGLEPRVCDVLRWATCEVSIAELESEDELMPRVEAALRARADEAEDRLLAARVQLTGMGPLHKRLMRDPDPILQDIRSLAIDLGELWVEKVQVRTRAPVDLAALRRRDDPLGGLLRSLDELRARPEEAAALAAEALKELEGKLPRELKHGPEALDWSQPEALQSLLDEVEQLLVPLLAPGD